MYRIMNISLQQTYFIILFTLLVGQGDGQWKKPSREAIQQDLKLYKKISENIKEEIEDFYREYPDEPINDYFLEEIDYVQDKINKMRRVSREKSRATNIPNIRNEDYSTSEINDLDSNYPKVETTRTTVGLNITNLKWPKFEEILLDIGKQYDWKNDRWIKVKKKNPNDNTLHEDKYVNHQKHNFKYRIVKLNRAKSKRNIVIAVTAVR